MNREMAYPEDMAGRLGDIAPRYERWSAILGDPHEALARVFADVVSSWDERLPEHVKVLRRTRMYAQAIWEVSGRVCWSLDEDATFALAMTVPPDWSLSPNAVLEITGSRCVFISIPPLLVARHSIMRPVPGAGNHGADMPICGMYLWDDVDEAGGFLQMLVIARDEKAGRMVAFHEHMDNSRRVDNLIDAPSGEPARAVLVALNLIIALKHTRIVNRRVETFPALKAPGKVRIETRRGLTRAPITRISLEVGPPMGTVQERRERAESNADTGRTLAPHWVRGHWHRFWTGEPAPTDKPDATKPSKYTTLHRVVRWVRPYYTGETAPPSPRVKVELYREAGAK